MPIGKLTKLLGLSADENAGMASMQASIDLQREAMEELKNSRSSDYEKLEDLARRAAEINPEFAGILEAEELNVDDLLSVFNSPAFQKITQTEDDLAAEYDSIIEGGGLSETQKSAFRQTRDDAAARSQAEQKSIRQQEMLEGRSGSGIGYAQKIAAQQEAAQAKQRNAEALANMAERGKMSALQGKQALAGQQGNRAIQQAEARKNVEQFNALQRTGSNQANLARRQQLSDQYAAQQRQKLGQFAAIEGQRTEEDFRRRGAAAQGMQNFGNAMAQQAGMQASAAQANAAGNMALVGAAVGAAGSAYGAKDGGVKYAEGGFRHTYNQNNDSNINYYNRKSAKEDDLAVRQYLEDRVSSGNMTQDERQKKLSELSAKAAVLRGESPNNPQSNIRVGKDRTFEESLNMAKEKFNNLMSPEAQEKKQFVPSEQDYSGAYDLSKRPENAGKSPDELKKMDEAPKKERGGLGEGISDFGDSLLKQGLSSMRTTSPQQNPTTDLNVGEVNIQNPLAALARPQGQAMANGGIRRPEEIMADMQGLMEQERNTEDEGKDFGYKGREILEASLDRQPDDYNEISDMLNEQGDAYEDGGVTDYSDDRLTQLHQERNKIIRQIEENNEMGNLRANNTLKQQLSPIEAEMIKNAEMGIPYQDGGVNQVTPELIQATQMLRTNNQPAPGAPMPGGQPPMPPQATPTPPQSMPMPLQGIAPQGIPMPPQGAAPMPPMPPQGMPQGLAMADGGMAYEDGGEGTLIPGDNYEGDELPDRINSGEMVLNVEQQDRLNDALMELKRLKSRERTDKMLAKGEIEVNPMQQESLMSFVRGEIDIDEVPSERVVKEPSIGEPTGNMAQLLSMVSKKRRG